MAFGDNFDKNKETSGNVGDGEKRESPFLPIKEGMDVLIRILPEDEVVFWTFWMKVKIGTEWADRSVIAGPNSPVHAFMKEIGPDDKRFRKPSRRWRINVLERTPNDRNEPLNKVRILEGGAKLKDQLKALNGRVRSPKDFSQKLTLDQFDVWLITTGSGKDNKNTTVMQQVDNDVGVLPNDLLLLPRYDLKKICEPIPNEALQRLLDGEDYGEIMKSIGRTGDWPMYTPAPF